LRIGLTDEKTGDAGWPDRPEIPVIILHAANLCYQGQALK
jgi:hypothetical protein